MRSCFSSKGNLERFRFIIIVTPRAWWVGQALPARAAVRSAARWHRRAPHVSFFLLLHRNVLEECVETCRRGVNKAELERTAAMQLGIPSATASRRAWRELHESKLLHEVGQERRPLSQAVIIAQSSLAVLHMTLIGD